jgi:glutaminyl-peptide cyclotransferase
MRLRSTASATAAIVVLAACLGAQSQKPVAAPAKFDSGRAWEHLRRQVSFGPRPAGSAALGETRRYILDQLKAVGIDAREQAFDTDTPIGRVKMANIVGTIPGKRPERIALATHFDTKLFREFRFVGASDGASSTAAVLELGRVLKRRANPFTIELLFFDGEEAVVEWQGDDNTYGSRYYVEAARRGGTLDHIGALVLVDMIGERNPRFLREAQSTAWLTDIIWNRAKALGRREFVDQSLAVSDDHLPFLAAGIPAVDIIDLDYPAWHTPADTLDQTSARTMQIVGDVVVASLAPIEARLGGN